MFSSTEDDVTVEFIAAELNLPICFVVLLIYIYTHTHTYMFSNYEKDNQLKQMK